MTAAALVDPPRARYDRFISRLFRTVILQPTTYCPWACDYCYLPTKDLRLTMLQPVAEAVAANIEEQRLPESVEVVWHGGEPLATGIDRFEALLAPFEDLRRDGRANHAVQTGGGLITPAWCELFQRYAFTVGVSIDGPEWANSQRHDRAGRSAYSRIMRGIRTLQDHGIPFTAIAVVTPSTITRADEIAEFFERLGCVSVGFNIEEHEGVNDARPDVGYERAREFWLALLRRRAAGMTIPVRDLDRLISFVSASRAQHSPWTGHLYEPIPTVSWDGKAVILSPELAGIDAPEYDHFVLGSVLQESIPAMLARAHATRYVDEFTRALTSCATDCEFYDFCLGAQAGNRYFEHANLAVMETRYCRNTRQALVRALHDYTQKETA
jgi:uncharacterized protein